MDSLLKQDVFAWAHGQWEVIKKTSFATGSRRKVILEGVSAFIQEMASEVAGNETDRLPGGRLQRKLEFIDGVTMLAGQTFEVWLNGMEVRMSMNHSVAKTELVLITRNEESPHKASYAFFASMEVQFGAMAPTISIGELRDRSRL